MELVVDLGLIWFMGSAHPMHGAANRYGRMLGGALFLKLEVLRARPMVLFFALPGT